MTRQEKPLDEFPLVLVVLWGMTMLAVVVLGGFLYLHATITDGWREDLRDVSPVMLPLLLVLLGLTLALRRRWKC
jgi:hypothetical protein